MQLAPRAAKHIVHLPCWVCSQSEFDTIDPIALLFGGPPSSDLSGQLPCKKHHRVHLCGTPLAILTWSPVASLLMKALCLSLHLSLASVGAAVLSSGLGPFRCTCEWRREARIDQPTTARQSSCRPLTTDPFVGMHPGMRDPTRRCWVVDCLL